jgi:transcriptional regulator with XRE-family HTH domain
MELAGQIKKYRADLELSQEALAEKIYVSRQTISNWETEKSYPDINSLIRMSEIFGITVDKLLKGDAEEIKQMIRKEDQNELNRLSIIYGVMMLVMMR